MSYAVSMGHGSPRCLSSRRGWMRTRLAGLGAVARPGAEGAAASPLWPAAGVCADVIVYRPSLEAHVLRVPGYLWMAYEPRVAPTGRAHSALRRASHVGSSRPAAQFARRVRVAISPRATRW